ncbi:hypothetical protein NTH60_004560 [Enterobacter ludwigii]|nr:hypothetical protein [Enterobacter ludwigii]
MVKSSAIFKEIAVMCTLLAMQGVIPSLLEIQYQLKKRIECFCEELHARGFSKEIINALCRLICLIVDLNAVRNLEKQGMSWSGYELEHVFYGYGDEQLFTARHADELSAADDVEIRRYITMLASLSPIHLPLNVSRIDETVFFGEAPTLDTDGESHAESSVNHASGSTIVLPHILTMLTKQLSLGALFLVLLWSVCMYYLKGEMG